MKIGKMLALAAVVLNANAVFAEAWDFTKGCPDGWIAQRGAAFTEAGLVSTNIDLMSLGSGCRMKKRYVFPEAFRFEAEFTPSAGDRPKRREGLLWDDMLVNYPPKRNDCGLQVALVRDRDAWTPVLYVGLSNTTSRVAGPVRKLEPGKTVRLVFLYDANRCVHWDFDGVKSESYLPHGGGIAPGKHAPTIGDRGVSNHWPLDAALRRVSITPVEREEVSVAVKGRRAFERAEKDAVLRLQVESFIAAPLSDLRVSVRQRASDGTCVKTFERTIAALASEGAEELPVPVETRLRPGEMSFEVSVTGRGPRGALKTSRVFAATVGPRFADRMPALMWGFGHSLEQLAEYGFTHGLDYGLGFATERSSRDDPGAPVRRLDAALAAGVRLAKSMNAFPPEGAKAETYWRRTRTGASTERKDGKPQLEVSHPDMVAEARRVARCNVEIFGDHPAFAGVLPVSENRDGTFPSFNTEHLRYKAETGRDVPPEVVRKTFGEREAAKRFPDGVVPEDDPVLAYYRWFWHGGDGWPGYTGAVAEEYRKAAGRYGDGSAMQKKRPFFSFWDPAVRCPPVWGSGGDVDVLNQWIYAVPEPMNVAGPLEEMFAMTAGRPGQQVMMMTQLICYRSQIAPSNTVVSPEPEWVRRRPRAGFPSIPPDTLQEATWSMLAKPVKGVMYHGWGTICETGHETGYCYTNEKTTERIKELLKGPIRMLGPMLKRLGREDSPVVVLESATTALLGGPASWGWSAPAITFLQRARLDPRVVYEETVLRDGFGNAKVLYAPQCRFLTPSVIDRIKAFQSKGGILVGDEQMTKALVPDVLAPLVSFKAPPASDHSEDVDAMEASKAGDVKKRTETMRAKATMLRQADEIRDALAAKGYRPCADSSSGEIVVYSRRWKNVPYLFAINDRRTFGDYVGAWGMTMENGLPNEGSVSVADPKHGIGAVYELSRGGAARFARGADGRVTVPVKYDTNDGRLFAFLPEGIGSVKLLVSEKVKRGGVLRIAFRVFGKSGRPVPALLPVEVRVRDASGRELDGAGWACAVNGTCALEVPLNLDDAPGAYTVTCRDRASGLSARSQVPAVD